MSYELQDGPALEVRVSLPGDDAEEVLAIPLECLQPTGLPDGTRVMLASGEWVASDRDALPSVADVLGTEAAKLTPASAGLLWATLHRRAWCYRFPGSVWRGPYDTREEAKSAANQATRRGTA